MSGVTIHFQPRPPQLKLITIHTTHVVHYEIKRLPHQDPVIFIAPSSTSRRKFAAPHHHALIIPRLAHLLATTPVLSIWTSLAVAKPGGVLPTHNLLRAKRGNLIKMILRNGTYHGFNPPPRNYIAAVIVIT